MSTNRGYGFKGEILDNLSIETKIAFTKKYLPKTYELISEEFEFLEDWEDFFENGCKEYFSSDSDGFGNIFAEVLRQVEDWNVDYATGENNYSTLMLNECFPWEMSEKMKSLTRENFEKTVNKYIEELKSMDKQDLNVEFNYDTIEYWD